MRFRTTKFIEIDAAHRVPLHTSKCRSLHGHRYKVEAAVEGPLQAQGSSAGMVIDFAHIKQALTQVVDLRCDHTCLLWVEDPLAARLLGAELLADCRAAMAAGQADARVGLADVGELVILPCIPTAEELARHWHGQIARKLALAYGDVMKLASVTVWETTTCTATFEGHP